MGLLDDAIREHLELKRRRGADASEVERQQHELLGSDRLADGGAESAGLPEPVGAEAAAPPPEPAARQPPVAAQPDADAGSPAPAEMVNGTHALREPAPAPPPVAPRRPEPEPWLDEPDEVPASERLDRSDYVVPDEDVAAEDVLEETPDFLQETPEHDRLWFEQKPPRDFDFGS